MHIALIILSRLMRSARLSGWSCVWAGFLLAGVACANEANGPGHEWGRVVLALGQVAANDQPLPVGQAVREGQVISTGPDGHLYIKTQDNGFLILRPNSRLRVPIYRVHPTEPERSQFKIELEQGVARSVSGQAVAPARRRFRFNTPVAAIGVVGTDFSVYTTQALTRVAVTSGGVVASGFGPGCAAEGGNPCDTPDAQRLWADQVGDVLQVLRGQERPERLHNAPLLPDPGVSSKSLPTEPEPEASAHGPTSPSHLPREPLASLAGLVAPPPPPAVVWGRWQPAAGMAPNLDLVSAMFQGRIVGINPHFVVLRPHSAPWMAPTQASAQFRLQAHAAQVAHGLDVEPATIENGSLRLDFAQQRFSTQFDLLLPGGERLQRHASGAVGLDGSFANSGQFGGNTMVISGAASRTIGLQAPLQAGYVFQTRLGDGRLASGVTHWGER
jgi:hypothetical protein